MNPRFRSMTLAALLGALTLASCNGDRAESRDGEAARQAPADEAQSSPGKPSAPISLDYSVVGTPVVGQPVSINVAVTSSSPSLRDAPITLHYRINDARNLSFAEEQAQRVSLAAPGGADRAMQQVTVVPQREGRVYLNVSAEIDTADGLLQKSMAIPIQVGGGPRQREPDVDVRQDEDGTDIISLPAEEDSR